MAAREGDAGGASRPDEAQGFHQEVRDELLLSLHHQEAPLLTPSFRQSDNINAISIIQRNDFGILGEDKVGPLLGLLQWLRLHWNLAPSLRNFECTNILPFGQWLIVDDKGVVSVFKEECLLDLLVRPGLLDNLLQDGVDFEVKGQSRAQRAFPSWVLGLGYQGQVISEVKALEMIAIDSSGWDLDLGSCEGANEGDLDELAGDLIVSA